jgi:hypothetical protein
LTVVRMVAPYAVAVASERMNVEMISNLKLILLFTIVLDSVASLGAGLRSESQQKCNL